MARTFDMKNMKVVVGTFEVKGFADGDVLTVDRMSDTFTDSVGADGEVERGKSNDFRGTITIVTQQTSPVNISLSNLMLLDEVSAGGIVPIALMDTGGNDVHVAPECWLVKPPTGTYGKEVGKNRSWVFRAANVSVFFGGN